MLRKEMQFYVPFGGTVAFVFVFFFCKARAWFDSHPVWVWLKIELAKFNAVA